MGVWGDRRWLRYVVWRGWKFECLVEVGMRGEGREVRDGR